MFLYIKSIFLLISRNPISKFKIYYLVDKDGLFHHDTLPSLIAINISLKIRAELYYSHGVLFRKNGPALLYFSLGGLSSTYCFHENNTLKESFSLTIGPDLLFTEKFFYKFSSLNGSLFVNSYSFSSNGPSLTGVYSSGSVHHYYLNGNLHRTDGPAVIEWDKEGKLEFFEWWLDGARLSPLR